MSEQTTLDGYTKSELHKIVDIYNLGLDVKTLNKKKADLIKEMKKAGKKKLVDLPTKENLKKVKKKPLKQIAGQSKITSFAKK